MTKQKTLKQIRVEIRKAYRDSMRRLNKSHWAVLKQLDAHYVKAYGLKPKFKEHKKQD